MIKISFIILMPKNEDLYPVVNNYFLESKLPGTLEHWNPGTLEHWNAGTLELWNPGTLELWNFGTLEHWNIGTLEHWNFGTLELTLCYPSILLTCFVASINRSISSWVL